MKSEELVYLNVDGQGRSQAQLQAQIDPNLHAEDADGDEEYVGEPEGDDDADASGEPDYGDDDEEADPMNLQPGDVLDGGSVPPLTASQEDAEGEDEEEDEISECSTGFGFPWCFSGYGGYG
jgi:hypothetical protein